MAKKSSELNTFIVFIVSLLLIGMLGAFIGGFVHREEEPSEKDPVQNNPSQEEIFEDYVIASENLISDYTLIPGKNVNNIGGTEDLANSYVLQHGIPVEAGKTYGFVSDGQAVTYINKIVFKSADNILDENWDSLTGAYISNAVAVTEPITAPEGAAYMFIAQIYDGAVEIADMECVELVHRAEAAVDLSGYTMMTLGDSLSEGGYWQDYVKEYT